MRFSLNLRARFMAATVAVVLVPLSGFIYAVDQFIDIFEQQVLYGELDREMGLFEHAFRAHPEMAAPQLEHLRGYIVRAGEQSLLPEAILAVEAEQNREIKLDGAEFNVTRKDVGSTRLYLVLDIAQIENFESRAVTIAWVCGVSALLFALLVAFLLSSLVLRPVKLLARDVSGIEPGRDRPSLAESAGDRAIGLIAQAFNKVLDRFDDFMAREQAFTEDASHELRTPLAIVSSSAQLLAADEGLSEKSRARLARLQMAARHMHELIEALLFLAREDGGGVEDACSVREVLDKAVAVYGEMLSPQQRQRLRLDVQGDHLANAPRGMVLAVVNNLLRNAMEHGDGGPVDVRLDNHGLVVVNSGTGIDAASLPHIFERRIRGSASHGQGLGLFIVKRICDRLGWAISVRSAPERGARFELRFGP